MPFHEIEAVSIRLPANALLYHYPIPSSQPIVTSHYTMFSLAAQYIRGEIVLFQILQTIHFASAINTGDGCRAATDIFYSRNNAGLKRFLSRHSLALTSAT